MIKTLYSVFFVLKQKINFEFDKIWELLHLYEINIVFFAFDFVQFLKDKDSLNYLSNILAIVLNTEDLEVDYVNKSFCEINFQSKLLNKMEFFNLNQKIFVYEFMIMMMNFFYQQPEDLIDKIYEKFPWTLIDLAINYLANFLGSFENDEDHYELIDCILRFFKLSVVICSETVFSSMFKSNLTLFCVFVENSIESVDGTFIQLLIDLLYHILVRMENNNEIDIDIINNCQLLISSTHSIQEVELDLNLDSEFFEKFNDILDLLKQN